MIDLASLDINGEPVYFETAQAFANSQSNRNKLEKFLTQNPNYTIVYLTEPFNLVALVNKNKVYPCWFSTQGAEA